MSKTDNNLPEELKATIKDAAETYAGLKVWIDKDGMDPQLFYEYIATQSHIAGATEYAQYKVRCEKALNRIIQMQLAGTVELRNEIINEIKSFLDGSK